MTLGPIGTHHQMVEENELYYILNYLKDGLYRVS